MVTFQEYLDNKYPTKEEKEQAKEITTTWNWNATKELDGGELDLSEYPDLEKVEICGGLLKSKLVSLNVNSCSNLTVLNIFSNQLTHLDLSNCARLKELNCSYNLLTELSLNPQAKLKRLDIKDNNFSEQDLDFLEWRERGFSSQEVKEVKEWLNAGLLDDSGFAIYLTKKGYHPQGNLNLKKLRKQYCKASEWLDANYPKEKRSQVEEIYLNEPGLGGELDLGDFTNRFGVKSYIAPQVDETKLIFKNLPEKVKIIPIIAQRYVDYHYPTREDREKVEKLDISYKNLEGDLDLSDFVNLKLLSCSRNKLTFLNLSNCFQLGEINCNDNLLTKLILPADPTNLKQLLLQNNNFSPQDLSFLTPYTNLEKIVLGSGRWGRGVDQGYNCFTGSLDYLSGMKQLKELDISNTNLNEVNIDKLPRSLEEIECFTAQRPDCKLTEIVSLLERFRYGWCQQCQQPNTSYKWCQSCQEKEWQAEIKNLTGQEVVEKFIEQRGRDKLQWIPYEQFANIEQIGEGGFSKICKACWKEGGRIARIIKQDGSYDIDIVLKFLNDSQNITLGFLNEIANGNLCGVGVVKCYGVSQDPETKNYVMVMRLWKGGNLRQYLQDENNTRDSEDKFWEKFFELTAVVKGLSSIHQQNLVHCDFHSGNVLRSSADKSGCAIADLGLCRPANYQKQEGQIFGVLPYIAPEILQGQPYTKASDVYSFGIVAYEWLANSYPYYDYYQKGLDDEELREKIYKGLRPNIDELKIPQLLKDLIKRCWGANPDQRPNAEELEEIINNWSNREDARDVTFYHQYLKIINEYNRFSENNPYKLPFSAVTHSKPINTKEIAKLFQESEEKALKEEIKKIEQIINQPLTDELKELVSNFIQTRKTTIKDKENEEAEDKVWELEGKLKEKDLTDENVKKIIKYCERFIKAERELRARAVTQAQVEIPTNNK